MKEVIDAMEQCAEIAELERDMWDPDDYSYKACDKIARRIRGLIAARRAEKTIMFQNCVIALPVE